MIYLMFVIGLLPIIFVLLLIGFVIGRVAKRKGRNPWLWGVASFLLIVAVSWKQMPTWSAYIYYKGTGAMQAMKPKESITTLAEANKINIHSRVDGVNFDVPLTYHLREYNQKARGWSRVSAGQISGAERPVVDYIHIVALLPDLVPMSEGNVAEFEVAGNGKKVMAALTHYRSFEYYFKNWFSGVEPRPEAPDVKGMLHFYDPVARHDMYLSHNHATQNLTEIICDDQSYYHHASPSCKISTTYATPSALVADEHITDSIFRLEYTIPSQYLPQWREIDQKLKSLFDQFVRSAA